MASVVFCLGQSGALLLVTRHHGLVSLLGDLLQGPVFVKLVGDLLQFSQPFFYLPQFPPLLCLFGGKEHLGVVPLRHRCPPGPAVVLVDPAGKAGVALSFSIIAEVEREAAVGALDQPSKGLDFVASILPPPGLHHLMDGVPQLPADQRLMDALDDNPLAPRRRDAGLIKEALELGAAKGGLAQIDRVIEDGPDGGGMPVLDEKMKSFPAGKTQKSV